MPDELSLPLFRITLFPIAEKLVGTDVLLPADTITTAFWSGDGTKLYAAGHTADPLFFTEIGLKHFVYDLKTKSHSELKLPDGHHIKDVSPDGKLFIAESSREDGCNAYLVPADGGERVPINGPENLIYFTGYRFSPDGNRILIGGLRKGDVNPPAAEGWLVNLSTADPSRRINVALKEREFAGQYCWSAFAWQPRGRFGRCRI